MSSNLDVDVSEETANIDDDQIVASTDRKSAIEACRTSLDFLASIILTTVFEYNYPALFKGMWQLIGSAALTTTGKLKYALGIPRGFAKTVILKLYCVWVVLFTDRKFILIICNTQPLAWNFLSDVADMLDSSNIVSIFGNWRNSLKQDNQTQKVFSFRGRDIIIAAIGSGGSLRGLNLKYVRPDIVIMDDMQNRDEAENPEVAKDKLIWMLGTLMKACHPKRCVFIFVGNMYPFEGSILRKLKHSEDWISLITGAILADGESVWPEHRSIEDLLGELKSDTDMGHPELFFSEVMNDEESGTVSGIDISKIPMAPIHLDMGQAQGGFIIIDPSLGKKKSDDVGIGAVLVYDGKPVLKELAVDKFDPFQCIQKATLMAQKYNMQLIIVEGVAYQESLCFWFEFVYKQLGVTGINVGTISPAGMQKNARIFAMLKQLLSGEILLHKDTRSQTIYQISQWNPGKTNNKDEILDILAYAYKVIAEYAHWVPLLIMDNWEDNMPEAAHTHNLALAF